MSEAPRKGGYIGQAWLVILLALLYGAALAGVETTLGPIIEQNKRNETYSVIPKLIEGADKSKVREITITAADGKPHKVYEALDAGGTRRGWVVPAAGSGFADRIELLIGLDAELKTITGLYVLDQKETPGLGNFIGSDDFQDQFAGKSAAEPLSVVKTDPAAGSNQIRALSGATISSQSVADIVNRAIENVKQPLLEIHLAPAATPENAPRGRGG